MTTYKAPTHEEGYAKAEALAEQYGIPVHELRWFASNHLAEQMRSDYGPDHGMDIGSSDTSIHLASLANYEFEVLEAEAQRLQTRNDLVARVAASTGKSEADTLNALHLLFAPAD